MPIDRASVALNDYLVLDLTRARAGPTAARQLADFGADVIKIETPGDPMYGDLGTRHGPDFQNLHRNKRSLTLNLKEDDGKAIFFKLAEKADVIVENYRPEVKFRLGVDYEEVKKINKRIVYASISGFGQDGPYAYRAGLDQIAQGMGGHMSVTGQPGTGPWRSGAAISDMMAGVLTATGILGALLEREKSGEGQWLNTSLLEAQIYMLDFQAARWLVDQDVPPQVGNNHPTNVPMGTFKSADGYVNIAPMATHWPRVCKVLGKEELEKDDRFVDNAARFKNRDELNEIIAGVLANETTSHWVDEFNDMGVPCGPINKMDQVFADPQVKHLGVAQKVTTPARGEIEIIGQPVHFSRTPSKLAAPSPELGQHADEILTDLGYDHAAIDDLRTRGVI